MRIKTAIVYRWDFGAMGKIKQTTIQQPQQGFWTQNQL